MFGRSREVLDYTVWPSEEGANLLAQQAEARIEVIDGVDHLDGYKLPVDNDEVWNPRMLQAHIVHIGADVAGQVTVQEERYEFPSRITNAHVREVNVHCIAQGGKPFYIRWEDVDLSGLDRPQATLVSRFGGFLRSFIENSAV